MKNGVSVVLLAYREEENLRLLLPQIKKYMAETGAEYELLVIDTAVPADNTESVCKAHGARYIPQEESRFGGAFRTGIKYAEMDKFLILDSDGSHNPKYIPALYEKFTSEKLDVAIGSRYVKGGSTNDAKASVLMSKILNGAFRLCLGIKARDISTDYRIYRTEQLKKVSLSCENYDVLQEVLLKLKMNKKKLSVGEVPITFDKRMFGESKRKLLPFIVSYIKTLFRLLFIRFRGFLLYGFFGLCAAVADYGISLLINHLTGGSCEVLAAVSGAAAGLFLTFFLNTFFNFKKTDRLLGRFASYTAICLTGLGITALTTYLFQGRIPFAALKLICIVGTAAYQFFLNKYITYRK